MEHIWNWYEEMTEARGSDGFGPAELRFADIDAWSRLMRIDLTPWEVSTLRKLDAVFRGAVAANRDGATQTPPPQIEPEKGNKQQP